MRKLNPENLCSAPSRCACSERVSDRTRTQPQTFCTPHTLYCAIPLLPASLKSQHPGLLSLSLQYFLISRFLCHCGRDKYLGEKHSRFSLAQRCRAHICGHDMGLSEDNQSPAHQPFLGFRTWVGALCISSKPRLNVYLLERNKVLMNIFHWKFFGDQKL